MWVIDRRNSEQDSQEELKSVYNGGSLRVSTKCEEKRTFKTRENLDDYDDQYLIEGYRLDRHLIKNVCELIRGDL